MRPCPSLAIEKAIEQKKTMKLRDIIDRCRHLALLARHAGVREELQRLANEMERDLGAFQRQDAAATDKLAG